MQSPKKWLIASLAGLRKEGFRGGEFLSEIAPGGLGLLFVSAQAGPFPAQGDDRNPRNRTETGQ